MATNRFKLVALVALATVFFANNTVKKCRAAEDANPPQFQRLEGCYYVSCYTNKCFYVLNPEIITIGGILFLTGTEGGKPEGVRDTDFSGQAIYVKLRSIEVLQNVAAPVDISKSE